MTYPVINLVCTRATQGDFMALQRWYSDHVLLLMAAPELAQASLYRCTASLQGAAPDYACVYEFADHAAFLRYEHGEPKAAAAVLTDAAPGRSSIEIVQRTQYARFLNQRWSRPELGALRSELGLCLQIADAPQLSVQRWLADALHQLHACSPLLAAQCYVGCDVDRALGDQVWLKVDSASASVQAVWQALQWMLLENKQESGYGQRPDHCSILWAAQLQPLSRWNR
jgi:hypothetical protein